MTRRQCPPTVSPAQEEGQAHTCQTEIKLNGTHTMRGEQETRVVPHLPEYLYLGQYQCHRHFIVNMQTIFLGTQYLEKASAMSIAIALPPENVTLVLKTFFDR